MPWNGLAAKELLGLKQLILLLQWQMYASVVEEEDESKRFVVSRNGWRLRLQWRVC